MLKKGKYDYEINTITIFTYYLPQLDHLLEEMFSLIDINKDNISIEFITMDNWEFVNEQIVDQFDEELLEHKIYLIYVYENKNQRIHIQIDKNECYCINVYFYEKLNKNIVDKRFGNIVSLCNEQYKAIAIHDDNLVEYDDDVDKMINKSGTGILWIVSK